MNILEYTMFEIEEVYTFFPESEYNNCSMHQDQCGEGGGIKNTIIILFYPRVIFSMLPTTTKSDKITQENPLLRPTLGMNLW